MTDFGCREQRIFDILKGLALRGKYQFPSRYPPELDYEHVARGAKNKNISFDVDAFLALDQSIRPRQQQLENLQAERNAISKSVATCKPEERGPLIEKVATIKQRMAELESSLEGDKQKLQDLLLLVPNPARDDVPVGKDDSENVEVKTWGTIRKFDFEPLDHETLGQKLDILDRERASRMAGSRSYILKGAGAQLEQAVLRFTYDLLVQRGYTAMSVPVLVRDEAMVGTGYFPTGRDQAYYVEKDALALVGTSEVALASFHAGEILDAQALPLRYMAYSACFRREAGAHGKDVKGLYRVHQFHKIEQVIICPADEQLSAKLHDELLQNAEAVLQALELPYRVVYVCTGDLGQGQVRKHDIETWMPSRGNYGETHSCSTFHDFQARRLKIRYRNEQGKTEYCHTLNNTAIATPRVLIPLLEYYQNRDGSVTIPKCLQPYMGGRTEIR
jgi:seryl-tRNA synthetase